MGVAKEMTNHKSKEEMKKTLTYALAGALFVCAGCSDDNVTVQNPVHKGDPIVFNARAGFESPQSTRTVYTDAFYTENGKTYERVDWVTNTDKVRIYCAEASNPYEGAGQYADYLVVGNSNSDPEDRNNWATLESTGDNGSLQWGDVSVQHNFYAVYPSPLQFEGDSVSIDGNTVKGIMPVNQKPLSLSKKPTVTYPDKSTAENVWVGEPDMRYAFLVAHTAVTPSTLSEGEGLNLSFNSIATALELELAVPSASESISLTDVMLKTTKSDTLLCGQFEADLSKVSDSNPYPTMKMGDTQYSQNYVNVSLYHDENGTQVPLTLKAGEKVQLTLFLLPVNNLSGLQLVVTTTTGSKTLDLDKAYGDDNGVVLTAHMKHLVKNLTLPQNINSNEWIKHIDDDVLLSQLSIPGTTNSYSYEVDDDNNKKKQYKYQTKTIDEQWNLGVRCFEVMMEKDDDFGNQNILLDNVGTKANETLNSLVSTVNTKLTSYDTEFAMIIVKYQPIDPRDDDTFVKNFITYFDSNLPTDVKTVRYQPGLTVEDVRGRIMFVLRAGSEGEAMVSDDVVNSCQNKAFLLVNGWGSLQDKWTKRGYQVNDKPVPPYVDYSKRSSYSTDTYASYPYEYYMLKTSTSSTTAPTFDALPTKGTANYAYSSNIGTNDVWAQEWPRVVNEDVQKYTGNSYGSYYWWANWASSYDEKLKDAEDTFDKTIADKENSSMVYFNHIGGYFVDPDVQSTYVPCFAYYNNLGSGKYAYNAWGVVYGNIDDYSKKINSDFYNYILDKGESVTGPMGVIIFNRAGDDDASTYLPNVIVSNNFKFSLKKETTTTE